MNLLSKPDYRLCLAPMVGCTDHLFRKLVRLISPISRVYTEMLVSEAVNRGNHQRLLYFDPIEHPIAVQLAGCEPVGLAQAAQIAAELGYDEINLNIGCPSPRVKAGAFGACLFKTPERVAECVAAIRACCQLPVSVKTRIGVDDCDKPQDLDHFIERVSQAGCQVFMIHARKAWLKGLNPKQNRQLPPLDYQRVCQLKAHFPHLTIVINGGIDASVNLSQFTALDGVMIGRAAYQAPWQMAMLQHRLTDNSPESQVALGTVEALLAKFAEHALEALDGGFSPFVLLKHLNGLTHGQPGATSWRRQAQRQAGLFRQHHDPCRFWQSILDGFPG